MEERSFNLDGYNLLIFGENDQDMAIREAVNHPSVLRWTIGYEALIPAIHDDGLGIEQWISPILIGRDSEVDYKIVSGAPWGSAEGAYLFNLPESPEVKEVSIELPDGSLHPLPIIGIYEADTNAPTFRFRNGILMRTSLLLSLIEPETVVAFVQTSPGELDALSASVGQMLPQATALNYQAYLERFIQQYQNLFVFAVAMAGLALLAGILLVANAVGLAMINRRYEIGVLKAVGYTRGHILTTVVMEYSLMAVIATVTGLGAVKIFLLVLGSMNDLAGEILQIGWGLAFEVGLVCVGLTLLTALLAAWGPTRVPPAVVLNDRG
jgi:ABC-type antimicrobial peptide transport system permease subunit